jgi:hypothetical protein
MVAQWQRDSVVLDYGVAFVLADLRRPYSLPATKGRCRKQEGQHRACPVLAITRTCWMGSRSGGTANFGQHILRNKSTKINYQVAAHQATQTHYQQMRLGSDAQLAQRTPHLCNSDNPAQYCDFDSRHSPSSFCMVTFIREKGQWLRLSLVVE